MFWRKVLGSLAFAALLLSATHAHAHSPKVFVVTESSPFSEEPGQTQDEMDVPGPNTGGVSLRGLRVTHILRGA
jgi:hypothetical protein